MSHIEEKIKELAIKATQPSWKEKVAYRKANKKWLKKSAEIALRIMDALENMDWNQAKLAKALDVSAQQVSKIVKGKVNFTLDSLVKMEEVLSIQLIAVLQEDEVIVKKETFKYSSVQNGVLSEYLNRIPNSVYKKPVRKEYIDKLAAAA